MLMKRILLFLSVLVLAGISGMSAQCRADITFEAAANDGYVPLLKEGKVWVWNAADHGQRRDDVPVYFTVTGQELVDGRNCFRIQQTCELDYLNGHEYLLSEENRQVELRYLYEDGIAYYVPLYDFNLKPGQFCQVWEADEDCIFEWDPFYEMEVKAEGNIMACGNVRRKIELEDKQTNKSVVWVEGIGAPGRYDMLTRFYMAEADNGICLLGFRECIDEGKTIFTMADFEKPLSSMDELPAGDEGCRIKAPTYDMMGRRVASTVRGGIYIRDGKKFVGQ